MLIYFHQKNHVLYTTHNKNELLGEWYTHFYANGVGSTLLVATAIPVWHTVNVFYVLYTNVYEKHVFQPK